MHKPQWRVCTFLFLISLVVKEKFQATKTSRLLLFALDVVATRLRAPNLEHFREIIAEYLEQVTYCLYGYPSKKARSRHIGKHDAVNIELDWKRGMQLFDIYRPDNLPEFNSYK